MPFNFKEYEAQCSRKSRQELERELQHYESVVTGASAGTGISIITAPLTMGVSLLAIGGTAPAIHNARKKREILRKQLQKLNTGTRPLFSQTASNIQRAKLQRSLSASSNELPPYDPSTAPTRLNGEKQTYDERSTPSTLGLASIDASVPPAYNENGYRTDTEYAPPPGPPPSIQAKEHTPKVTEREI